jgi:hypothetical protein
MYSILKINIPTEKLYDYQKSFVFDENSPYCVSGKINSTNNKLYLIIETAKIDTKNQSTPPHTKE